MNYAYYPGCSLTASAVEYDLSTRLVLEHLGEQLTEIEDWTCCGASAVEPVSRLLTRALPARNLALALAQGGKDTQVLAPCSACYLNLLRVNREAVSDVASRAELNEALSSEALAYAGEVRVRHLLDVLLNDIGVERIGEKVVNPLEGIRIAPYYGCQILRPYPVFDDAEHPVSMEPLLQAMDATVHEWGLGGRCCGASLMATNQAAALASVRGLLEAAQGADAIATVCPMCQMNLEAYQSRALDGSSARKLSILYLPQLLALSFGLESKQAGIHRNLAVSSDFLTRCKQRVSAVA
ncbi:MAG: CoB--CoM heterodisulfide reductase iron-sulfur subunit B family protein [Proteobacteria bacterium]|nr:CoB--CoM heterodisulfide reductase iron-sulfur subunit B family protein [Pseudomonadota bacterium]